MKNQNYFAVYAGRRLHNEKIFHCFIRTDNKKELYFSRVVRVFMGHTYKCGANSISRKPEFVSEKECVHNPQWEALDAQAENFLQKRRAETAMNRKSKPHLKKALEALMPIFEGLTYFERRAVLELLLDKSEKRTK